MILDTNAVSAFADGDPGVLNRLRSSRDHSLPVIVLGEYRYGLLRSHSKASLQQWLQRLEGQMEVLAIAGSTATHYAAIRKELTDLGRPIPENDVWIAALAREHRLAILSRDTHFDIVPNIVRVGW